MVAHVRYYCYLSLLACWIIVKRHALSQGPLSHWGSKDVALLVPLILCRNGIRHSVNEIAFCIIDVTVAVTPRTVFYLSEPLSEPFYLLVSFILLKL